MKEQHGTLIGAPPPGGTVSPPPRKLKEALKGAGNGKEIVPDGTDGMGGKATEKLMGGRLRDTVMGLGTETEALKPGGLKRGNVMP